MSETKARAGRPTDYDPSFCERVIELGREGKSLTVMAAQLGVSKQSVYLWIKTHSAFSDAMEVARTLAQEWWEDKGQEHIVTSPGQASINAALYNRSMSARFPDDWREKTATELTGPDGGPIQTEDVSDKELARRVAFILAQGVQQTQE